MARATRAHTRASAEAVTDGVDPRSHALYALADVEAALGRSKPPAAFAGDPDPDGAGDGCGGARHETLRRLVEAGEDGRWRDLAQPTAAAVDRVRALDALAPHLRGVTAFVVRRLLAGRTIGLPVGLAPLLLLGPPGLGKTR